jgi:branched-chain amino acid transport system ATP-binding protein/branched-chain amino acid transport system permease protein
MNAAQGVIGQTRLELAAAAREARSAWSWTATLWVLAFLAAALVPLVLAEGRMADLAGFVYLALAAVGLGYAVGLAGIPSLGQGAFLGIGAFTEALLRAKAEWPLLPSLLVAIAVTAVAGVLTGIATGRLRSAFVAASTWILSWIVLIALTSFPGISGGAQGLVLPETTVLGHVVTPTGHYLIGLTLVALAILALAVLAPRGPGLALAAGRDQPAAALGLGVAVARSRLGVFTASATIAGLAGALGVELAQVADPSSYGPVLSFELFVAVILGGARLPLGPVVGLAVISGFRHLAGEIGGLRGLPPGRLEEMLTGYGMLLVLGLGGAGLLPAARLWWRSKIPPKHAPQRAAQERAVSPIDHPEPLEARGVTKRFGSLLALDDLDLDLQPGKVHALIGPNGSGKTTALRTLVGELAPDSGTVRVGASKLEGPSRPRTLLGVVGTQQATAVFTDLTVLQNALVGAGLRRQYAGPVRTVFRTPKARREDGVVEASARAALDLVGLSDADRPAAELTAHEQRLLMLASALATQPRVLLLDEPAAGASTAELDSLAELLDELRDSGLALLVIEHNLRFVRRVADRVTVLEAGKPIASGTLAEVAADEAVRTAYLGRQRLS